METRDRLFLPADYRDRPDPAYFVDAAQEHTGIVHQPDVYEYAAALAGRMDARRLIDIGCGRAEKLLPHGDRFDLLGVDHGENIRWCRDRHDQATWIDWDLGRAEPIPISEDVAAGAVVICSDVIEHLVDPVPLVRNLVALAARSRAVVLSTPDRVRTRGPNHLGPPPNRSHVREWSLPELVELFGAHGAPPALAGFTRSNDQESDKETILLTFGGDLEPPSQPAPAEFSVQAIICAYNEADIIGPVVSELLAHGVRVHLIDNWSTDGTHERFGDLAAGNELATVERFPAAGPERHSEWAALCRRVEQVAAASEADWIVFQDADEIRRPPWPGVGLRDGIWAVDRTGYTVVDHTVVDFRPVDFTDYEGTDPLRHFTHFQFGQHQSHFVQQKAWKHSPAVTFGATGGHRARFEGARVYPLKFTDLHFSIRSHAHGRRKVLRDRRQRWLPAELANGWHGSLYDFVDEQTTLVWDAANLHPYDPASFEQEFMVELTTGVNIPRLTDDAAQYGRVERERLMRSAKG